MSNADASKEPAKAVNSLLQPHPLTSVMQMAITFSSLCVAMAAILFGLRAYSEERNARLVEIGASILGSILKRNLKLPQRASGR